MNPLACRGLTVDLDGVRVLDDLSFTARDGEWLCIVGPNGAGKTTVLRAIAGLVPATGVVEIAGRARHRTPRLRARSIAMVAQSPVVPPAMRVLDYVLLGRTPHLSLLAAETGRDLEATWAALGALDLDAFAGRRVDSLSGGERQRVFVARALAQDAPILLLDEPTAALDIGHQQEVLELVDRLRLARNLTVVSTMHDLTLAGQYAERLLLLRGGRVTHEGRPDEVLTTDVLRATYGADVDVVDGPHGRAIVPRRAGAPRRLRAVPTMEAT